jgi:hypothetical protein
MIDFRQQQIVSMLNRRFDLSKGGVYDFLLLWQDLFLFR